MEAAKTLKKELENDRRNLGDLWVAAMSKYQGIMGFKLERKYENLADITAAGTLEMENFHKWRHNQGKVDRLRTLLSQNPELVELGTQQLVSAATTSFPPAVAIGTALAHLLGVRLLSVHSVLVCRTFRTVIADYRGGINTGLPRAVGRL